MTCKQVDVVWKPLTKRKEKAVVISSHAFK